MRSISLIQIVALQAGLVELTQHDRATLLGGMMKLADMLGGEGGPQLAEVWKRRGKRLFEAEGGRPSELIMEEADAGV